MYQNINDLNITIGGQLNITCLYYSDIQIKSLENIY